MEAIAKSTEGTYLDAKDSEELLSSLKQALQIEYEILDEQGRSVAEGYVGGEAVGMMEGSCTLRLLVEPEPFETPIIVESGKTSSFTLAKVKEKWTIKK